MNRTITIAALFLIGVCAMRGAAADAGAPATAGREANVAPAINEPFKSASLDPGTWAERFTGESREVYTARMEILKALALKPGEHIADVGAGTGLYVKLFAEAVGPGGQVYANDIAPKFLAFIAANAARDGLANVRTVLGTDRSANLPAASLDVIFHSDVYHHFEYPMTMNADLHRSLKPDGRLYVLDFEKIEGVTTPAMMAHVRAGKAAVTAEIEAAGFRLVEQIAVPGLRENYLLYFRKAGAE
ncbi:MAG: class I SAM-dependent methyltransferase [Gammaproteobacteria bacterium]